MRRAFGTMLAALLSVGAASAADELAAFPRAEPGMARHVLRLPRLADEDAAKVELAAGKTIEVDARNRYFFGGTITAETVPGFGYTRYVVSELGPLAGTLMAVDPNEPKVDRFIALGGEPMLVRYNSRLPIVVYAPEGVEVRFRIWHAAGEPRPMKKG